VEIVRIAPTDEQLQMHGSYMRTVQSIVRKPFLTEMDLLRLRASLLMCRMAANSTFLVDKKPPGWSSKLERLGEIFDTIAGEPRRKVVLFSEWTTMLDLIEPLLEERKIGFVRLDGAVPQTTRQRIVARFQDDPQVRVFLTTNAGSTGLNLQAANTVINVDLPWNPAVLEQRIARAHRMGQKRPVSVFVLVTEGTLEDNLLGTLSSKRDLAMAALDPSSEVSDVDVRSQSEDIKAKLEVLLGEKKAAPVDRTAAENVSHEVDAARVTQLVVEGLRGTVDAKSAAALLRSLADMLERGERRAGST
jgi:SNF2 family DNA or RNA helicase